MPPAPNLHGNLRVASQDGHRVVMGGITYAIYMQRTPIIQELPGRSVGTVVFRAMSIRTNHAKRLRSIQRTFVRNEELKSVRS